MRLRGLAAQLNLPPMVIPATVAITTFASVHSYTPGMAGPSSGGPSLTDAASNLSFNSAISYEYSGSFGTAGPSLGALDGSPAGTMFTAPFDVDPPEYL